MTSGRYRASGVFIFMLGFYVAVCSGQRVSSDILGTVTDPTGAVIADAQITVTRIETAERRTATTNEVGVYRVAGLNPGNYQVTVAHPGFKTTTLTGIVLLVNQQALMNVMLPLGNLEESVTVVAEVSLLETTSSGLSGVVTASTLRELPLNGRDLFQLALLETGVLPLTTAGPNPFADGGTSKAAVNGARPTMNNVNLDGSDINDPAYNNPPGGVAGVQLGVDGIQEFRVLLNNYSSEFGRNAGANVQYVTRSGGNDFHGSLFEFHRNAAFDARNFFDRGKIPPFVRNQFGGTLGGPIRKNRTFFFTNFEGLRESRSITQSLSVPDGNAHSGFLPSAANPSQLVNVGVDPRVAPLLNLYPLPTSGSIGSGLATLQTSQKQLTHQNYGVLRIDESLNSRDKVFARYVLDDSNAFVPFANTVTPGFPSERTIRNQYLMLNWTRFFGANLLNEAKLSFSRLHQASREAYSHPLSISLSSNRQLGAVSIAGLPQLGSSLVTPIDSVSNTYEAIDNLSYQWHSHQFKVGGNFKRLQNNGPFDALVNGAYIFGDLTGFGFPAQSNNPSLEFFLRAVPLVYLGVDPALADSDRGYRQNYLGLYFQDDWSIGERLNLNFGIRWEYWSNPSEAHDRLSNIRNPLTDTEPTVGNLWESVPLNQWSPRLGFAWRPAVDDRMVIRGGFGLLRDQIWTNAYGDTRFYQPFFRPLQYLLPVFQTPPTSTESIMGLGGPPSVLGILGTPYHPDFPYYLQYNLNVQRELPGDFRLQVAYVGSRGIHLLRSGESNPFLPEVERRINPNFGPVPMMATDAQSSYNSGQLNLQRRFSKGFLLEASYTFSKSLDDASGLLQSDFTSESGVSQNFYNRGADRGRSGFDRTHALVVNYLYQLPVGPQRHILFRGWAVSGITTWMSGAPFTANLGSFNNSGTRPLTSADRPNLKPNAKPCGEKLRSPDRWFDPAIFTLPDAGQFGNAGRNVMCGPGLTNFDFSVTKETLLKDGVRLQFRAEFFNLFNHPNFDVPINTQSPTGGGGNGEAIFIGRKGPPCQAAVDPSGCGILAPNVGQIFRTTTTSRQIQFGLKLTF